MRSAAQIDGVSAAAAGHAVDVISRNQTTNYKVATPTFIGCLDSADTPEEKIAGCRRRGDKRVQRGGPVLGPVSRSGGSEPVNNTRGS